MSTNNEIHTNKRIIKKIKLFFFAKASEKLTTETSVSFRNLHRSILTSWTSPTTIAICRLKKDKKYLK